MVSFRIHRGRKDWFYKFDAPGSTRQNRKQIRKYGFPTKKAAETAEAEARLEAVKKETIRNVSDVPATFDLLFEKFLALHCQGADPLSPTTVQHYREHRAYLDPELLQTPPDQITRVHLSAEWKRLRERGGRTRRSKIPRPLGARTVCHVAATVSSVYTWAAFQGFVTENPVKYSEKPPAIKKRAQTVSRTAVPELLSADAGFWCQPAYLETALALGARRGEILALRWSDWRDGRFFIERNLVQFKDSETGERRLQFKSTKENREKEPPSPETLRRVLEAHRRRQNEFKKQFGSRYEDNDLIFCQEDGRPLYPNTVSASVSRLIRSLGLPPRTSLHSLRHTSASELLSRNVPLATISKRLGHSSIRTTADIYSHALDEDDYKAAEAYDDYRRSLEEATNETVQ
jgi:integrase